MRSDEWPSVAVIGAAGFVGRELLSVLGENGVRAVAVVRGNPEMAADTDFHVVCSDVAEMPARSFDRVINLAYPTSGSASDYPGQTEALFRTVDGLLRDGGHLTHVSSLAVFGAALDRPVTVGPVRAFRAGPYIEAKIAAEHEAARVQAARGLHVDVVRLGNVVGPASATWAVPLVQRLLTGRPVQVAGSHGYSNATDVANVASYLAFLDRANGAGPSVRYHHLAELSATPWKEWIDAIAGALGVEAREADRSSLQMDSPVRTALVSFKPSEVYQALASSPAGGSWTRSLLRRLPARVLSRLKGVEPAYAPEPRLDPDDRLFLAIMAVQHDFEPVLLPGWKPPVAKEASIERLLGWLRRDWELT
jgi:nucleoside-diphosphate-sugar epimerase